MQKTDDWKKYYLAFSDSLKLGCIRIMLEDYQSDTGDAYFDDIKLYELLPFTNHAPIVYDKIITNASFTGIY